MVFFAKTNILLTNVYDAERLDDKKESEQMTSRERHQAEVCRETPSMIDFLHYLLMINVGSIHEYRQFKEWVNYEGDHK